VCVAAVPNDAINRLRMGMPPILQSYIGKDQLMVKKTFSCNIYHFIKCCKAITMVRSKLNCNVINVGVVLVKSIVHSVIKTYQCFLVIFLDYECTTKLRRILLQFKVYFTFEPSKVSKLRPSPSTNATLSASHQSYWIPAARQYVKSILHRCIICHKVTGRP